MSTNNNHQSSWSDFLALLISFIGVIISFWGALTTYATQTQIGNAPLWPLPALILIDWVLLGSTGFISAYFCFRRIYPRWLNIEWICTGAMIPLIIIGAFSIGPLVLIGFLLFVISAVLFAIPRRVRWLESFGLLMLGSIGNLGIVYILIRLGNQILNR